MAILVAAFFVCDARVALAEEITEHGMEPVSIDLRVATVNFAVPKMAADYSEDPRHAKQANIFDEKLFFTAGQAHVVYSRLWGFKGHFWQGYIGELLMQVSVFKIRQGSSMDMLFSPSSEKELININDVRWRKTGNMNDQINYDIPLTSEHFLGISFSFIDDSNHENMSWQLRAQQIMELIVPTLKLDRHSATEMSPITPEQQPVPPPAAVFPVR